MSLSRKLFHDGLFTLSRDRQAPRSDDERDQYSYGASDEIYDFCEENIPYPEVALMALTRALAEIVSLQENGDKRAKLIDRIKEGLAMAVEETLAMDDNEEEEGEEEESAVSEKEDIGDEDNEDEDNEEDEEDETDEIEADEIERNEPGDRGQDGDEK